MTRGRSGNAPAAAARLHCRLCDSHRLRSVLDLGASPAFENLLTIEELDLPETMLPLHLRLCDDCLLLQIPALIKPEDIFTEYAQFSSFSETWVQHAKDFVDQAIERLELGVEIGRASCRERV